MQQLQRHQSTCAARQAGSGFLQLLLLLLLRRRRRRAFMRAVSRCLDCSGLLMMTATWCTSSPCNHPASRNGGTHRPCLQPFINPPATEPQPSHTPKFTPPCAQLEQLQAARPPAPPASRVL